MKLRASVHGPVIPSGPPLVPVVSAFLAACVLVSASLAGEGRPIPSDSIPAWIHPLTIQGTLEGEFHWARNAGPRLTSGPRSSLYLRRVELAASGKIASWVQVLLVANSEYIGDLMDPGDERLVVDEGHLDLQRDGFPIYLVLGKRTQPFAAFENHLITNPLTQDGYEVNRAGLTLGVQGSYGADISATCFTGAEQIDQLFSGKLFDVSGIHRGVIDSVKVQSLIIAASFSPLTDLLTLLGSYVNEPGAGRRNSTADLGLTVASRENRAFLDLEVIRALSREVYPGTSRAYKDGALSVTAGYASILKMPRFHHGGTFRGRRARTHAYPFVLAVRYERFDDDGFAADRAAWSTRDRVGIGGTYTFAHDSVSSMYGMLEVRRSSFRVSRAAVAGFARSNPEVMIRLGILF